MSSISINTPQRDVFTVSRLIREARATLEASFPLLWLEGEISNFSRPGSGHMYFSLKDEAAQVRCAMFRGKNLHLRFMPKNGMRVMVRAKITLYEARGDFQIIIEHMEESGLGALQRAFDELKQTLGRQGLFDQAHKKPLPTLPKRIGIITSPTGAAIRDIESVLKRRCPAIPVLIYPSSVQGNNAASEIAEAIRLADIRQDCDVLILTRGGGSLEDLWSFNEELVARAIHNCSIPIISAVGHEVDFTIADFVADMRAPTPSAAAELVAPNGEEILLSVTQNLARMHTQLQHRLKTYKQQWQWLDRQLHQLNPARRLQEQAQHLDDLEQQLYKTSKAHIQQHKLDVTKLQGRLFQHAPIHRLRAQHQQCNNLAQRLHRQWQLLQERRQQQLANCSRALDAISPLATLQRGYAIVESATEKTLIRQAAQVKPGEKIRTRLAQGHLVCTVNTVENNS